MPLSPSSSARASVVLPAPEGDDSTRSRPRRAMRGGEMLASLLNVLHLLSHLVDHHFQGEPRARYLRGVRLGAQRIGLAIELLRQEIELATDGSGLREEIACRGDVHAQAPQFFLD